MNTGQELISKEYMEKIKELYFYYYCNIGMYIQDNVILDAINNKTVNIMKKNEAIWHQEFQNIHLEKLKQEKNPDIFIYLQIKLFLSIKTIKELYTLACISASTIINNNLYDKEVFMLFYHNIILLINNILLIEKNIIKKNDNLFKCLKKYHLYNELENLISLVKQIIKKDLYNAEELEFKNILKLLKQYS